MIVVASISSASAAKTGRGAAANAVVMSRRYFMIVPDRVFGVAKADIDIANYSQ
jgi:hypothetical protein